VSHGLLRWILGTGGLFKHADGVALLNPSWAMPTISAPTGVPEPSRSPTLPAETASQADDATANDAADRYTVALVRGDFRAAWAILAPESQSH
jgi:hypothetical protein